MRKISYRSIYIFTVCILASFLVMLSFSSCSKQKDVSEAPEDMTVTEAVDTSESDVDDDYSDLLSEEQDDTASADDESAAKSAEEKKAAETEKKEKEKKKNKSSSSEKKSSSTESKKWIDPVYKTVEHPEEGHYETQNTGRIKCCGSRSGKDGCGVYFNSMEAYKAHQQAYVEKKRKELNDPDYECQGDHAPAKYETKEVWVVDKPAWTEQVLVSEGHWE